MYRTERHIIIKNKELDQFCFLSKNLYNYCNYQIKQYYISTKLFLSYNDLIKTLTKEDQIDYRSLPTQTSQQIIMLLYKNWVSFFKKIKIDKSSRPPKYKSKTGRNIVIFTNQQIRIKDNFIHFPKMTNLEPLKTKITTKINEVRILPQQSCFIIEVVYKKEKIEHDLDENLYLSIDLGINNLCSMISNSDLEPILLNGKIIKSINQFYNKRKALLMSYIGNKGISNRLNQLTLKRNNLIQNYLHHTSKFIITYCIKNKIKNIVIGYNKDWKQGVNIGKVNNQKFVSIPYIKLINQITYKAEENNITVILNEESYTSKCDSLVLEPLNKQDSYLGKRVKRGLFQSSIKKVINADVNGSINILRKVIGDDFIQNLTNRGLVFNPVKVNPLQSFICV